MALRPFLLAPFLVLLAGCSAPGDAPPEGPVDDDASVQEWQEFAGTFQRSTHVNCFVGFGDETEGLLHRSLVLDGRSKGESFVAYLNVTDDVHVLFTRVELLYAGNPDPTRTTYGAAPGGPIRGRIPDVDVPVTARFDVCGTTGQVAVEYRAPLAPEAKAD